MMKQGIETLSIEDTNVLKGVAILLMLWHHLFLDQNGLYDDFILCGQYGVFHLLGQWSKVCVAIFVFLSGYGLAISSEHDPLKIDLRKFYMKRAKKIYLNYWLVWLFFVPISYFVFDYTFIDAYGNSPFLHLIIDFFGLHKVFFPSSFSYNPTWWFYSCIIILYLLFPFLYKLIKHNYVISMLISVALTFLPGSLTNSIRFYIIAFVMGIGFCVLKIAPPQSSKERCTYLVLLVLLSFQRFVPIAPQLWIDCFITICLIQVYRCHNIIGIVKKIFAFLGKHSMNIFLFHSFIFYFWFQDYIYISRNPFIIFFTLLMVCIPISLTLEKIKICTIYKL